MDPHRVDVFDEADGDLVALFVADDFEFELLPAEDALFDQHLADQRGGEATGDHFTQLLDIVDDAAAGAAHGVGGAEDHRIAEFGGDLLRLFDRVARFGFRHGDAEHIHGLLEFDAVFAALDRVEVDADDLDVVLVEDAGVLEGDREVERGLSAEVGQQGVGPFAFDDLFDAVDGQGFDVGVVGHAGVGHDGGGVGVGQHHFVPLFAERLARLGSGVVEFTCLPDDDRSGTDNQDLFHIFPLRHKTYLSCLFQRWRVSARRTSRPCANRDVIYHVSNIKSKKNCRIRGKSGGILQKSVVFLQMELDFSSM